MASQVVSKADLHIHTKYSDRPSEWLLRRIGAPESFVEPLELYKRCRARGMDFVTVSDHNRIEGALDIAHLPGTFISVESTVYFPEDRCKTHVLISGITEEQFREIERLRENIYELQPYLLEQNIVFTLAHPLFRVNDKLTPEHLEKLLVLFNRFEIINGARHRRASDLLTAILDGLTKEDVYRMAEKHGLEPLGEKPWEKFRTGGSDDHGGLFGCSAYTETPSAPSVTEYLDYLRMGKHCARGRSGSSLQLGSSLYQIAYSYYHRHFLSSQTKDTRLIGALFQNVVNSHQKKQRRSWVPGIESIVSKFKQRGLSASEQALISDLSSIFSEEAPGEINGRSTEDAIARQFDKVCRVSQQLAKVGVERFVSQVRQGYLIESFQALSSLGLIGASVAPYLAAFKTQHKDEAFHKQVAQHFPAASYLSKKSGKRAWITDTFNDMNGVSHTIRTLSSLAYRQNKQLTVVTCMEDEPRTPIPVKNFKPVGVFSVPEYETQEVMLPPFLEMLEYFESEGFDEVILSTPGPMGVCGRAIAHLLGLKTVGVYHTDFPRYVNNLTDDHALEELAWKYMGWFYKVLDRVFVPSSFYRDELIKHGFESDKLSILTRGVDKDIFNPKRRNESAWAAHGLNGEFKYLYVGRVSKEKNVETLLKAFREISVESEGIALAIVGEGPELEELKKQYQDEHIVFTGALHGGELAEAYASCDVFVFPSCTDTYGNVVLEAHASGLPAIVSKVGGPSEIVSSHDSGLVVDSTEVAELRAAMEKIRTDKKLYQKLQYGAKEKAAQSNWSDVLEQIERC